MDPNNFPVYFRDKRFQVIAGTLIVILLVLSAFSLRPKSSVEQNLQPTRFLEPTIPAPGVFDETNSEKSPAVIQALQEQAKADQVYSQWQLSNENNYPWLNKLPLTSEKYFVYFDVNKQVFFGRLYVNPEDDVEGIKESILFVLKDEKNVPVESFQFEWMINP